MEVSADAVDLLEGMGFERDRAERALRICLNSTEEAVTRLLDGSLDQEIVNQYDDLPDLVPDDPTPSVPMITFPMREASAPSGGDNLVQHGPQNNPAKVPSDGIYDADMKLAILNSLQDCEKPKGPFDPNELRRNPRLPVGLLNVGNTCYFNSLLQTYFNLPAFRDGILSDEFDMHDNWTQEELERVDGAAELGLSDATSNAVLFARRLQYTIAALMLSEKKYIDPTAVLTAMGASHSTKIGTQQDAPEFAMAFFERVRQAQREVRGFANVRVREKGHATLGVKRKAASAVEGLLEAVECADVVMQEDMGYEVALGSAGDEGRSDGEARPGNRETDDGKGGVTEKDRSLEVKPEPRPPSLVDRLLVGQLHKYFSATEANGTEVSSSTVEDFEHISLHIGDAGDLHSALEASLAEDDIQYETPLGHKTAACSRGLFRRVPPIITLQLQRAHYDKTRGRSVKLHHAVHFDEMLYLDRYMDQYRSEVLRRSEIVAGLRCELRMAEVERERHMNYEGLRVSAGSCVHGAICLLQTRQRQGLGHDGDAEVVRRLNALWCEERKEVERIEARVAHLQDTIKGVWEDMRRHPYRLHAVLVHDGLGTAGGHYWAHVYSPTRKCWMKYNDISVSEVEREVVWRESTGGHMNCSAYCLIYVDASRTGVAGGEAGEISVCEEVETSLANLSKADGPTDEQEMEEEKIREFGVGDEGAWSKSISLVPPSLHRLVQEDNIALQAAVCDWEKSKAMGDAAHQTEEERIEAFSAEFQARIDGILADMTPPGEEREGKLGDVGFGATGKSSREAAGMLSDNAPRDEVPSGLEGAIEDVIIDKVGEDEGGMRPELVDIRLRGFTHFLYAVGSQDLMQYQVAADMYAELFAPGTLAAEEDSFRFSRVQDQLSWVALKLEPEQKSHMSLMRTEFRNFCEVARHYLMGLHLLIRPHSDPTSALRHLMYARHLDTTKMIYHSNKRDKQILRDIYAATTVASDDASRSFNSCPPSNAIMQNVLLKSAHASCLAAWTVAARRPLFAELRTVWAAALHAKEESGQLSDAADVLAVRQQLEAVLRGTGTSSVAWVVEPRFIDTALEDGVAFFADEKLYALHIRMMKRRASVLPASLQDLPAAHTSGSY